MDMLNFTEIENVRAIIQENLPCELNDFGKMIRSKIGLYFFKSLGVEITKECLEFLAVVELVHNASLFHDDVIDNELIRREQPTFSSSRGDKVSILYGNLALSNALSILLKFENVEFISALNNCVKKMCFGELLQQKSLNKIPTINEYIEKTRLKTSSLFQFLMKGVSVLSNTNYIEKFESFGDNFGVGFQIANDLADYLKGVENSSDIKNGIYTAPIIYAQSVKFDKLAIDKTKDLIDNYLKRAKGVLDLLGDNEYKRALIGEIECLMK
ncbi:polyprenyl synthetase family protein [bacterium]|nr:polyprenyl synthetase family protein [bacterium]